MAAAVAASDSSARSASTLRMAGWSASSLPNALRWRAWCTACAVPQRMPAAEPSRQSRRVWLTMRMIVGTPRPSSPTSRARTPSNSTSDEGSERVPSLSLRRWMRKPGSALSNRKQESPAARLREREEDVARGIGAEPLVAGELVLAAARGLGAGGVGAHVRPALLLGHGHAAEGAATRSRATSAAAPTRSARSGSSRSAGTAE